MTKEKNWMPGDDGVLRPMTEVEAKLLQMVADQQRMLQRLEKGLKQLDMFLQTRHDLKRTGEVWSLLDNGHAVGTGARIADLIWALGKENKL